MSLRHIFLVFLALMYFVNTQSKVITLDDSNFTSFISQNSYVFIKFYAPWCGHCKSMAPQYQKFAELAQGKPFAVAEVDATVSPNVSQAVGLQSYPTLKFFIKGQAFQYDGGRNSAQFFKWVQQTLSKKVQNVQDSLVKQKIGAQNFLLIQGASAEQLIILQNARLMDNIPYYNLVGEKRKITLHLKNSKSIQYTGQLQAKKIITWTAINTVDILIPLANKERVKLAFQNEAKLPSFLLLKADDLSSDHVEILRHFCQEFRANWTCAYADQSHSIFQGVAKFLKAGSVQSGQVQTDHSILAYFKYGLKLGYKVPSPQDITKQYLLNFVEQVNSGSVEPFHNNQKQAKQKQIKYQHVIKLTKDSYNQTLSKNQFVLIQYYSPGCGHCINFAPQYENLAKKLKEQNSKFVVAAVDLKTQEEVANWVQVKGYPTVIFYVKETGLNYEGARKAEDIIAFMNSASQSKLSSAASIDQIPRPAVVVSGIKENSKLNLLPVLFTKYPIYLLPGDEYYIKYITNDDSGTLHGEEDLEIIAAWLEQATQPVVIPVVSSPPPKKLNKALDKQIPLLVVVNRDESGKSAVALLQKYCKGKMQFICGYAHPDDAEYQSFNNWLGSQYQSGSHLLYLNTSNFSKQLYSGSLSTLNDSVLDSFISSAKQKLKQAPQNKQEKKSQPQPEQNKQVQEVKTQENKGQETEL